MDIEINIWSLIVSMLIMAILPISVFSIYHMRVMRKVKHPPRYIKPVTEEIALSIMRKIRIFKYWDKNVKKSIAWTNWDRGYGYITGNSYPELGDVLLVETIGRPLVLVFVSLQVEQGKCFFETAYVGRLQYG